MSTLSEVRELLDEYVDVGCDDERLEVDSLTLVTLIEAVEERFDIRVRPTEAVAENFGSALAIAEFIEAKRT